MYQAHVTRIRIGIVVCSLSVALMALWGAAIAARTRSTEGQFPVFTYAQLACTGVATIIAVLIFVVWAVAAFRPGAIEPNTTRMLNDTGWFLFLFDVPPFVVWCGAVGLAILWNKSGVRLFPRWSGYVALLVGVLQLPALFIDFSKDGPLAFNSPIAFWIPLVSFLAWVLIMSYLLMKEIGQDEQPTKVDGARASNWVSTPQGV
jgi:hypothetical protein